MIHTQLVKFVNSVPPAILVDDATLSFAELDTIGFDYLQVVLITGATDIGVTSMLLTDGDTAGSGHTTIAGTVWGTDDNIAGATSTIPSATNDNKIFVYDVDLKYRKRYIDATFVCGDGSVGGYYQVLSILSRVADGVTTAANRGCEEIIRV